MDEFWVDDCSASIESALSGLGYSNVVVSRKIEETKDHFSLFLSANSLTDMLESQLDRSLSIQVLTRDYNSDALIRTVALNDSVHQVCLAYASIKILSGVIPNHVMKDIVQEKIPFGRILKKHGISCLYKNPMPFVCNYKAYEGRICREELMQGRLIQICYPSNMETISSLEFLTHEGSSLLQKGII